MDFAYAVVHSDPPEVYFAEDGQVLSEVLARELVAPTSSDRFAPEPLKRLRKALLDREWGTAMEIWTISTGIGVDIFDYCDEFWTRDSLGKDSYDVTVKNSPIFQNQNG